MTFQYDVFDEGKKSVPNGGNLIFWFFFYTYDNLATYRYLNPYPSPNIFLNSTNSLIKWEYWSEKSSSSLEQNCESYKFVVWEMKYIRD